MCASNLYLVYVYLYSVYAYLYLVYEYRRLENRKYTSFKYSDEWLIYVSLLNYAKYFKITISLEMAVNSSSYTAHKHHMPTHVTNKVLGIL